MPTTKIPKLARNKYNYIEGVDGKKYVMQSQIMSSSIGGGGGGNSGNNPSAHSVVAVSHVLADRGVGPEDIIVTDSYANAYFATATYLSTYYISVDDLSQAGYVTSSTLSQASYLTQSQLSTNSYVTQPQLNNMSYATTSFVSEKCAEVQANAYAYTESKIVDDNLTSYNQVKQMIEDIISYMKSTGELISAAAVDQKISDSRV